MGRNSSYKSTRAVATARSTTPKLTNNSQYIPEKKYELQNIQKFAQDFLQKSKNPFTFNADETYSFIKSVVQKQFELTKPQNLLDEYDLANENFPFLPIKPNNEFFIVTNPIPFGEFNNNNYQKKIMQKMLKNIIDLKEKPQSLVALYNPELIKPKNESIKNIENDYKIKLANKEEIKYLTPDERKDKNIHTFTNNKGHYMFSGRLNLTTGFLEYKSALDYYNETVFNIWKVKNAHKYGFQIDKETHEKYSPKIKNYRDYVSYRNLYRKLAYDEATKTYAEGWLYSVTAPKQIKDIYPNPRYMSDYIGAKSVVYPEKPVRLRQYSHPYNQALDRNLAFSNAIVPFVKDTIETN